MNCWTLAVTDRRYTGVGWNTSWNQLGSPTYHCCSVCILRGRHVSGSLKVPRKRTMVVIATSVGNRRDMSALGEQGKCKVKSYSRVKFAGRNAKYAPEVSLQL